MTARLRMEDFKRGTYQVGRVLNAVSASYEPARTEPPRRYTQSDLLDAMMSAYKFASNDADRAVLKQIAGLGTSRTRESTITGLLNRGFVETRKSPRERARARRRATLPRRAKKAPRSAAPGSGSAAAARATERTRHDRRARRPRDGHRLPPL